MTHAFSTATRRSRLFRIPQISVNFVQTNKTPYLRPFQWRTDRRAFTHTILHSVVGFNKLSVLRTSTLLLHSSWMIHSLRFTLSLLLPFFFLLPYIYTACFSVIYKYHLFLPVWLFHFCNSNIINKIFKLSFISALGSKLDGIPGRQLFSYFLISGIVDKKKAFEGFSSLRPLKDLRYSVFNQAPYNTQFDSWRGKDWGHSPPPLR